jgi:glycogen(starch) synthase
VIIAGDGPQRSQLEADIRRHELGSVCKLWGEATADEVAMLLGLSDIFLYTSTRGINPVSILEAMAAGCVVVASTEPKLVANYLADGRGIPILAGDARAVATALAQAIHDLPQSREMGLLARKYVVAHHGATALQRSLRRATYFAPSIMPGGRQDAVVTTPEIAGQDARGSMRNRSANAVNGRSTV